MIIPFLGGAYEGRSSNVAPETCINLFLENGESSQSLVGTAGSAALVTPAVGEVRGGIAYNNLAYFVIGPTLYEINSAGTATSRGTLNTSTGRVSMSHNGVRTGANQQIFISDGSAITGYIYNNATQALSTIANVDYQDADGNSLTGDVHSKFVAYIDGYFLFSTVNSDRFYITSQYDGTTINPLDFATAEGWPDVIVSILADSRELYIFGAETLEVWYNSGDTDTTFQRFQGGFKQHGCVAGFSPAKFDNTVIWLSRNDRGDGQIVQMGQGYQPTVVSSVELNYQISTYSNIDQAFGYTYQHEGHEFYVITFPGNDATWAYDATTKKWHRRGHQISGSFSRERYNCHVFAFGEHLFGDYISGAIYKLDGTIGTFDGNRVLRERTTMSIADEENRRRLTSLQLDMEEGMGDGNTANDNDWWLDYSKDGGHTFGNAIMRVAGEGGDWARRVLWRRLGEARNWIFRIQTWTPTRPVLKGLIAKMYGEK